MEEIVMKARMVGIAALLPLILVVAGCATQPKPYESLASSSQLKPNPEGAAAYLYKAPNVDFKQYTKFIIPPVAIYQGPDAQFGSVSDKDKQEMADFIRSEFAKVLDPSYPIVTQPGPGVAQIKFTLAGLETTNPVGATLTHLAPVGIVMNLGKTAAGGQGSFMGSVTFAGEIYDSQSNTLIAAFVSKQHASAMDMTATLSALDSAKAGVTEGAEKFKAAIDKVQKGQ